MKIRIPTLIVALLTVGAMPLAAQQRGAPPGPPPIERLESLRLERLQESLGLTEEQTTTLRRQLEENRSAMRKSFERQHAAMESLHQILKTSPIDQEALRRALAAVESERERMESLRGRQMAELDRTFTLEQRAKFLLFNRQFDSRLRELVERHRGNRPGEPPDPGRAPRGPGLAPDRPEPTREQRIEMLERRIEEMQRELGELRSGEGS